MSTPRQGAILYDGPSHFDGRPIWAIVTGLGGQSRNSKTGPLPQLWIILRDESPISARQSGHDHSICGMCPLRQSACYVSIGWAPGGVWRAAQAGGYPMAGPEILSGARLRLGAYGDPAALPPELLQQIVASAKRPISYTHAWRERPDLKHCCLASVDNPKEQGEAYWRGWHTFRIRGGSDPYCFPDEVVCPATERPGVTCSTCNLCAVSTNRRQKNIVIPLHGSPRVRSAFYRLRAPQPTQPNLL